MGETKIEWATHGTPTALRRDAVGAGRSAFTDHLDGLRRLSWVIVGGESGHGARPMHPQWARDLRDQCAEAGVPFFFKQWGEWAEDSGVPVDEVQRHTWPDSPHRRPGDEGRHEVGGDTEVFRVGKRDAGRLLDGRTWDETPGSGA